MYESWGYRRYDRQAGCVTGSSLLSIFEVKAAVAAARFCCMRMVTESRRGCMDAVSLVTVQ